ncbi:MFS transporter [Planotetraspora sp. A-T 1434]|uniref:MFS transporter n=1 Tax=Planotetraspora sp. A-T 1434 TaxID=2979219 RepID=UPI0021BFCFB4|nr:MFS transporter [Planotetraspora sp. A-T 1434]MCT9935401.1 MFS transporter [Planotetraspora sp. A-T 1434]
MTADKATETATVTTTDKARAKTAGRAGEVGAESAGRAREVGAESAGRTETAAGRAEMAGPAAPLSRNRDYRLLWGGRAASELGVSAATIAFPLLVLAVTGSAATSGLVLGTIAAAQLLAGLPAGALADRWDRKTIMLGCEAAQAIAAASLVAAVYWNVVSVAHLVAVAAVIGVCSALFEPAEDASLPNIVPDEQLPTAVAMNSARSNLGHLAGTAAGGFLFAVGRFVPFAVDLLTHLTTLVTLAFVRLPRRQAPLAPMGHLGQEIMSGLRWVWGHRHVRVTAICAMVLNLFFSAFYLVVIVLAQARGVPSGQIGVMAAMLGVGGIVGALAAPSLQRRLTPYMSIAGVFWALTLLTPVAVFAGNGYVMGALFFAMALLPPTANTTIITEQLLLTPDELRGRLSGVLGILTGAAGAVGPALGGVLTEVVSGSAAVLVCAAGIAAVTVLVTVNPTLRRFPRRPAQDVPAESV